MLQLEEMWGYMTYWILIFLCASSSLGIVIGDGISITYFYLICPVIFLISGWKGKQTTYQINKLYKFGIIYFIGLATVGIVTSILMQEQHGIRSLSSCIAFLSVFSFLFVPKKYINESFLIRVLCVMVIVTFIQKIFAVSQSGLDILIANNMSMNDYKASLAKHSSACIYPPFIYYCITSIDKKRGIKLIGIAIGIICLALAFSRAAIICMVVVLIYGLFQDRKRIMKTILRFLRSLKISFVNMTVCSVGLTLIVVVLQKLNAYLYLYYSSLSSVVLEGMGLSENTRIDRWILAINHGLDHPFIGSRFLGVWAADYKIGSLHSGYFDVFYKTGLIGFIVYMAILMFCLMKLNRLRNRICEYTLISVMVYMIFYEVNLWPIGLCLIGIMLAVSNKSKSEIYKSDLNQSTKLSYLDSRDM